MLQERAVVKRCAHGYSNKAFRAVSALNRWGESVPHTYDLPTSRFSFSEQLANDASPIAVWDGARESFVLTCRDSHLHYPTRIVGKVQDAK